MIKPTGRVLWDRRMLPTPYVSFKLGVSRRELGRAIHRIKEQNGLRGGDLIIIHESGDVADERGTMIGNVLDEC